MANDHVMELDTSSRLAGVGAHDTLSAKLVAAAGFDALWVGSLEASAYRCMPDVNLITSVEMAEAVRAVRQGAGLPVLVDADNGYGSDEAALRALRLFAEAGAAGMVVEDNEFPKRNSLYAFDDRRLTDPDEFAQRLRALAHHRGTVKIIARTEALVAGLGVDEALRRLECYAAAGADAVFVQTNSAHAAELPEVLKAFSGTLPIVVAPTALPELSIDEFHDLGANLVLFANVVSRATIRGLTRMLAELRGSRTLSGVADHICDLKEMFRLTEAGSWNRL